MNAIKPLLILFVVSLFFNLGYCSSAKSLKECRDDWDKLLLQCQSKEQSCVQIQDSLKNLVELESNKSQSYHQSWNEAIDELRKCKNNVEEIEDTICAVQPPSPTSVTVKPQAPSAISESPNYWWAWLLTGAIVGALGVSILK